MKTKLIVTALLAALSLPVQAEVFKCQVDGKTVYQQTPCSGQVDTAQPMKIDTKDTGNGGVRESEYLVSADLHSTNTEADKTHKEKIEEQNRKIKENEKELIEERRHREMVRALILSGNPKRW